MANKKGKGKGGNEGNMAVSLDQALQASRKERQANLAQEMLGTNPQKLAQEMLGKQRRSNTPRPAGPGPIAGSLASRVGIAKRSASLPRPNSITPRNPRQPSHLSRPPPSEKYRPREPIIISSDSASNAKSNEYPAQDANGGDGLSIRGAASGPYIVRAQNFAPGTTAADIESVMQNVGGVMNYCKLIAAVPTVIAEMSFVERAGAQDVIKMFNNKKADGRTLHVFMQNEYGISAHANGQSEVQQAPAEEPLPAIVDTVGDTEMEVDEHADARAAEDRQREQRRQESRSQQYPTGPAQRANDYPRRAEPEYQDGRYGFSDRRYGGGGGGGRYRNDGGMYSDRMRRGGGQSWRP